MDPTFEFSPGHGHRFVGVEPSYMGREQLWRCARCGLYGVLAPGTDRDPVKFFSVDKIEPRSWHAVGATIVCRIGRFGPPDNEFAYVTV
jgi:hypothetical protein